MSKSRHDPKIAQIAWPYEWICSLDDRHQDDSFEKSIEDWEDWKDVFHPGEHFARLDKRLELDAGTFDRPSPILDFEDCCIGPRWCDTELYNHIVSVRYPVLIWGSIDGTVLEKRSDFSMLFIKSLSGW